MVNSSIILTNLDFNSLKNTFKSYLKSQDKFNDYDFEGSNINVLLDILAYNTYLNTFYLNMIGNEMFLDTAQLKDSVVSHAKELNYVPRSFTSSTATVNLYLTSNNTSLRSVTIPKGTTFSSRIGSNSYTFSTDNNIVTNNVYEKNSNNIIFLAENVEIYEGDYVTETFTTLAQNQNRYILNNKNIDVSSLNVTVVEDLGATTLQYTKASSLFGLTSSSQVYFIQPAENDLYEIIFGDNVVARTPKDNSVIIAEYRICNGELPNGAYQFKQDSSITDINNITIETISRATSGSVSETIEEIKYNAPRHFTTQERAVTAEDYETLMKLNFPEINAIVAYGGEELDPPQFGKVFVSVDLQDIDGLPDSKKTQYYKFLKPRSPVSIDPVFIDPEYTYIYVNSKVKYNINTTNLTTDDIRTLVISSILTYASSNLNNFNKTLRYSRLLYAIDNSQVSIISNETDILAMKILSPTIGISSSYNINFDMELTNTYHDSNSINYTSTISSSLFTLNGQQVYLEDDGSGNLNINTRQNGKTVKILDVGTVDYDTGLLQITNFNASSFNGEGINIYALPKSKDITTNKNVILNIREQDIVVSIEQIRA